MNFTTEEFGKAVEIIAFVLMFQGIIAVLALFILRFCMFKIWWPLFCGYLRINETIRRIHLACCAIRSRRDATLGKKSLDAIDKSGVPRLLGGK